jgi:transposase
MVSGKPISEEVQWIIIRLSAILSREDIATYTNVSLRKVNDVLSTFNKEGTVKVYTRQKPDTYSSLSEEDIRVGSCYLCTQRFFNLATQHLLRTMNESPDLYLDELCQDLELHTGKSVSVPTIWRTLQRAGYSKKKVRHNIELCEKVAQSYS